MCKELLGEVDFKEFAWYTDNTFMKKNPVVHFEMPAKDKKRVKKFYESAFGWEMNLLGKDMSEYLLATTTETDKKTTRPTTPGAINGGFFDYGPSGKVPHLVIAVDDIEEHIKIVKKAGGKVMGEVMDIPGIGKFAMFTDTEGNKVGMLQPTP